MASVKDLTQGQPGKVLIRYTLPLFFSVFFQQLYNIADTAIAGIYIGEQALAAIGASYAITMLFMAVAVGSQIGVGVVLGNLFGRKDFMRVRSCMTTALIFGTVLSLLLTAIGVAGSPFLMRLVNTPADIFNEGERYLRIYTGGFVFVFMYNIITALFSSLGDSKTPLYLLMFSSFSNIALDLLFVVVWKQGVPGLAWATFIAQAFACIIAFFMILRRIGQIPQSKGAALYAWKDLKDMIVMSIPAILQQSFISVGNLIIQTFINPYGSAVIAGYTAAIKLNTFAITCFNNAGTGMSGFTAQNLGAGLPERVKEGFRAAVKMVCVIALIFTAVYLLGGNVLLRLFLNKESSELALQTARNFMCITSPCFVVICIKVLADGILRGSGSMGLFMIATLVDLFMRVLLAWIFSQFMGPAGIWMAWPISWAIATVLSVIFYRMGTWHKHIDKQSQAEF